MKVLIACEFSGIVRDAFAAVGHDAWSCDLLPSERPGQHIQGDVTEILDGRDEEVETYNGDEFWQLSERDKEMVNQQIIMPDVVKVPWDLMIGHPPCTYLSNSGAKHLYIDGRIENGKDEARWREMEIAAELFKQILDAPIPKIAIENPIMHSHAREIISKPYSQIIQPWQFGHGETKATCLWLKGLPKLRPTHAEAPLFGVEAVTGRVGRVHLESPSPERWKNRSRTYEGIASAMAEQWAS